MTTATNTLISLDEAKRLVALLEANEHEEANSLVETITLRKSEELFSEVGKLTRQLHN